jgi:hypothetical protein
LLGYALATAAMDAVLHPQWRDAGRATLAFGGFSGGAKYAGWLAALFTTQGARVSGIFLSAVNEEPVATAAQQLKVLDEEYGPYRCSCRPADQTTSQRPLGTGRSEQNCSGVVSTRSVSSCRRWTSVDALGCRQHWSGSLRPKSADAESLPTCRCHGSRVTTSNVRHERRPQAGAACRGTSARWSGSAHMSFFSVS